mmetsp:Transcript_20500/g.66328  ORF Transcript_20500/g.66328 Transcript_20500/m.66328 type:complete len:388 (-) Transcript_20500:1522-2685(-)
MQRCTRPSYVLIASSVASIRAHGSVHTVRTAPTERKLGSGITPTTTVAQEILCATTPTSKSTPGATHPRSGGPAPTRARATPHASARWPPPARRRAAVACTGARRRPRSASPSRPHSAAGPPPKAQTRNQHCAHRKVLRPAATLLLQLLLLKGSRPHRCSASARPRHKREPPAGVRGKRAAPRCQLRGSALPKTPPKPRRSNCPSARRPTQQVPHLRRGRSRRPGRSQQPDRCLGCCSHPRLQDSSRQSTRGSRLRQSSCPSPLRKLQWRRYAGCHLWSCTVATEQTRSRRPRAPPRPRCRAAHRRPPPPGAAAAPRRSGRRRRRRKSSAEGSPCKSSRKVDPLRKQLVPPEQGKCRLTNEPFDPRGATSKSHTPRLSDVMFKPRSD